jgi:hypothetical protein
MKLVAMNREASANFMNITVRKPAVATDSLCGLVNCSIKSFLNWVKGTFSS